MPRPRANHEYVRLIETLNEVAEPEDQNPVETLARILGELERRRRKHRGDVADVDFVDGDLIRMAASLDEQERAIRDEDPDAVERRRCLNRAIAYLRLSYAELQSMPSLFQSVERAA